MKRLNHDVRFWPKANMRCRTAHVCFQFYDHRMHRINGGKNEIKIDQSIDHRRSDRRFFRWSSATCRSKGKKETNRYGRDLSITVLYDSPWQIMHHRQ